MFDALTDRLQGVMQSLKGHGKLTTEDIDAAMREIRLALLEADVNFKVVREFVAHVKERALGSEVMESLTPAQQVVKIVNEELVALMGGGDSRLAFSGHPPTIVLLAGLQGSGKTTTCAKLAKVLKKDGKSPVLIAADVYRPAAIDQLQTLAGRVGVPCYAPGADVDPVDIARDGVAFAREHGDVASIDTAGRLQVDDELMGELVKIRDAVKPHNILLVVDAMTGQDAVNVAQQFAEAVAFDGVVMTKLDGDARGGAALSVKAITGKPILFASTGEKIDQFERFHPDRMAQRILGMGDVLSLIEKTQKQFDEDEAAELERKLRRNEFTLEDFLKQLQQVRQMGPLQSLLGMMPGFAGQQLKGMKVDEKELDRVEAIIRSMTLEERRRPELIKGSRRLRIARGSGTSVQQVNQLVKQFDQMRKLMRQIGRGKMPDIGALMRQAR
jgi:signal recognition particle subunit SRP54